MTTMRERILNHVKANPGATSTDLKGPFNLTASAVGMHLHVLRLRDLIHRDDLRPAHWFAGPAPDCITEQEGDDEDAQDAISGQPRRVFVSDWEPRRIAPQGPFAALGL